MIWLASVEVPIQFLAQKLPYVLGAAGEGGKVNMKAPSSMTGT